MPENHSLTSYVNREDLLANIANLVSEYFQGDAQKVKLWFHLPNPMLGNISPRDMVRLGRYERLLNFVLDAHEAEMCAAAAMKEKAEL